MTPATIPAEIAPNLAMHISALAHYRAIEHLLIPLAPMTERNYEQAEAAAIGTQTTCSPNVNDFMRIARAKVDARWLAKDTGRLLTLLREIIGQTQESIVELQGFKQPPGEELLS